MLHEEHGMVALKDISELTDIPKFKTTTSMPKHIHEFETFLSNKYRVDGFPLDYVLWQKLANAHWHTLDTCNPDRFQIQQRTIPNFFDSPRWMTVASGPRSLSWIRTLRLAVPLTMIWPGTKTRVTYGRRRCSFAMMKLCFVLPVLPSRTLLEGAILCPRGVSYTIAVARGSLPARDNSWDANASPCLEKEKELTLTIPSIFFSNIHLG